jgi:mono/diheme cytochrome c family protein
LECHRDPASKLRPLDKITDLNWKWSEDPTQAAQEQRAQGKKFVDHWKVESLQSCSACHR